MGYNPLDMAGHTHKLQVEMVKEYDQAFNSVFCFTLFYSRNTAHPPAVTC